MAVKTKKAASLILEAKENKKNFTQRGIQRQATQLGITGNGCVTHQLLVLPYNLTFLTEAGASNFVIRILICNIHYIICNM